MLSMKIEKSKYVISFVWEIQLYFLVVYTSLVYYVTE